MTTAADFAVVPTPVADVARNLIADTASRADLLRALWKYRHAMTEQHYIATMRYIDQQVLPPVAMTIRNGYAHRWHSLIAVITGMLDVEAGAAERTRHLTLVGQDAVGFELGQYWTWDPSDPQSTITTLLRACTGNQVDQQEDTPLPGTEGTLRFTSTTEFQHAPRGDFRPDDEEDFVEEIRDALRRRKDVRIEAVIDSGGCPDVDFRTGVVLLDSAPWGAEPDHQAWVLIIDDEDGTTVIEYPSDVLAVTAFNAHVDAREIGGGPMYDYVVVPGARRTARPPSARA